MSVHPKSRNLYGEGERTRPRFGCLAFSHWFGVVALSSWSSDEGNEGGGTWQAGIPSFSSVCLTVCSAFLYFCLFGFTEYDSTSNQKTEILENKLIVLLIFLIRHVVTVYVSKHSIASLVWVTFGAICCMIPHFWYLKIGDRSKRWKWIQLLFSFGSVCAKESSCSKPRQALFLPG